VQASRSLYTSRITWLLKGLFVLLFLYFLSRADLRAIASSLAQVNLWMLLLSLLMLAPFIWAKSVRWGIILGSMGVQSPGNWRLCIYYTIGLFLGGVTPGQFGDVAKGWYLRNDSLPLQTAMLSVVVDRLCDMLIIALLGVAALTDFADLLPPQVFVAGQIGTLALALASGLFISQRFRRWLAKIIDQGVLSKLRVGRLLDFQFSLLSSSLPVLLALTVLSIGFNLLRGWLLFVALGVSIPFFSVFSVITLIAIFQVLPISIAGFGVREALLIAALQPYGYTVENALSLSLLLFMLNIQQILIGFLVSLFYPVQVERE
jgi:glycosyltransferase 2 family protein